MDGVARDESGPRFSGPLVIGILLGFPLIQSVAGGTIIEWGQRSGGRGWLEFFSWILVVEWVIFLILWRDLRRRGLGLDTVGFPTFTKREVGLLSVIALGMVTFVIAVGDSTSARIIAAPWVVPRLTEEKLLMIAVALTAGICEETIFRGYLFHGLRRMSVRLLPAVALATVSFVFIHGISQSVTAATLRAIVAAGMTGLYFWRGSLKLPILLHVAIDAQLVLSV